MEQIPNYGDDRNKSFCVHCGGPYETKDHIPSKILLDEPFPENLFVSPSCFKCNNLLSSDEEYFACILECILAGDVIPKKMERSKIARTLEKKPKLVEKLRQARSLISGRILWNIDMDRIRRVVLKLARGHVAYELNEPRVDEPVSFCCKPLTMMSDIERAAFEDEDENKTEVWPEVGSRAMSRLLICGNDIYREDWFLVQEGRYRFRTLTKNGLGVRIVLREYLACEVMWD